MQGMGRSVVGELVVEASVVSAGSSVVRVVATTISVISISSVSAASVAAKKKKSVLNIVQKADPSKFCSLLVQSLHAWTHRSVPLPLEL